MTDTTIKRSWQHMALSVAMCGSILAWYATRGASASSFVIVSAIGVFLVAYNIVRISRAREAQRDPSKRAAFAAGQLRSHRIRGRLYLVAAQIVVAGTWTGSLLFGSLPLDAWLVLAATTFALGAAWVRWLHVVRRL